MIVVFLIGFFVAIIGIALPGLINMTAAKISMQDGKERALSFVFGALLIILVQTYIAIVFCKFIATNYAVLQVIRKIGVLIFSCLTIYFFFFAKKNKPNSKNIKIRSKSSRFFFGMLLSSLNFFPIPFYVYIILTLSTAGYFDFKNIFVATFLLGVILGSFVMFNFYIKFFKNIETKTDFFLNNMNKIIGTITGIVTIISLIKILN